MYRERKRDLRMYRGANSRLRIGLLALGMVAALLPGAVFAYDDAKGADTSRIVAQATPTPTPTVTATPTRTPTPAATATVTATATRTASPTAPQTGGAGLVNESASFAAAAALAVLGVAVVAGGRLISTRRRS